MKKKVLILSALLLLLCAAALGWRFYTTVPGSQVAALLSASAPATVRLIKTLETSERSVPLSELTLDETQHAELLSLLENSRFERILSKTIPYSDTIRYIITAERSGIPRLRLEAYGGEFLLLDFSDGASEPLHYKLRIQNERWGDALEALITE